MNQSPQVLLVDVTGLRPDIESVLAQTGLRAVRHDIANAATSKDLREADVAIVSVEWSRLNGEAEKVVHLIQTLAKKNIATLVLGVPDDVRLDPSPLVDRAPIEASREEIAARVATFARFAPFIRRLDRELHHLQRLGKRLNHHFADIDQEMRLAGRLQRDFLPRGNFRLPPITIETLFRPASWVSGDVYDIFRIDERHVGVFLADAVGHGMAAGMLTMFLRQALNTKRIDGKRYSIVEPAGVIGQLHRSLVQQALPNCWFVTGAYVLINHTSLEIKAARGGHPYPIIISADGSMRELQSAGALLGLADLDDSFEQCSASLNPGDKVLLYSDGLENAIVSGRRPGTSDAIFTPQFAQWAPLPAREFLQHVGEHLDRQEGSLNPADDVTAILIEVAK